MENKNWKDEIQEKLDAHNVIAIESTGILTSHDVLTAIKVVEELESDRDESSEWEHIRKLQQERAERIAGGTIN